MKRYNYRIYIFKVNIHKHVIIKVFLYDSWMKRKYNSILDKNYIKFTYQNCTKIDFQKGQKYILNS